MTWGRLGRPQRGFSLVEVVVVLEVEGDSAIVVAPIGQIRLRTESYVAEAKKLQLDFKPNPGDDQFILKNEGLRVEPEKRPAGRAQEQRATARPAAKKLEGFLP